MLCVPLGGGFVHLMLRSAFTCTVSRLRRRCLDGTVRHPTTAQPPLTYRSGSRRAHKVVQLWLSHHLRRGNQKAQGMSSPSSRRLQGSGGLLRCIGFLAPSSAFVWPKASKGRSARLRLRSVPSLRSVLRSSRYIVIVPGRPAIALAALEGIKGAKAPSTR